MKVFPVWLPVAATFFFNYDLQVSDLVNQLKNFPSQGANFLENGITLQFLLAEFTIKHTGLVWFQRIAFLIQV